MCGGIVYNLEHIPTNELKKFYTEKQIALFKNKGLISSFFWDKRPLLPVIINNKISLFDWGNRDKSFAIPQTGWAKEESIKNHRWDYLEPQKIKIPAIRGYEKGIWFESSYIDGILIKKNNDNRAYMITIPSTKEYLKKTSHVRMPKTTIKKWLNIK